jgi:hypothetical protein
MLKDYTIKRQLIRASRVTRNLIANHRLECTWQETIEYRAGRRGTEILITSVTESEVCYRNILFMVLLKVSSFLYIQAIIQFAKWLV